MPLKTNLDPWAGGRARVRRATLGLLALPLGVAALTSAPALAQPVPVSVVVDQPAPQPGPSTPPAPGVPTPPPPAVPSPPVAPAPGPAGPEQPANPPKGPLPFTGADVLRVLKDAALLIGAGLLMRLAARTPAHERNHG